jgi:aminomethyltransferase
MTDETAGQAAELSAGLRKTPLHAAHLRAGARMVDFGGFHMPVKYQGESAEHAAVRGGVGVFDVSHMGEIFVTGKDALVATQRLVSNDAGRIVDGQAMYAGLLNERGGFVDDVVVYRFSPERFLFCVNAANQEKDLAWMQRVVQAGGFTVEVTDEGHLWSQLAVQGPNAADVVAGLCGDEVRGLPGFHFVESRIGACRKGLVARTGYTGEDGFELYLPNEHACAVWDEVLQAGAVPCGLAARDTLRLEAGLCLYGNDIDEDHTPLQANLGFIVKLADRPPFVGQEALVAEKAAGVPRLLRGLVMTGRGIARPGYEVKDQTGARIGVVTSGTQAPHLQQAIAMAWLDKPHTDPGGEVFVDIRGKPVAATICKLPFYKRPT